MFSPVPVRYPQGMANDYPYGLFANYGLPNKLSYIQDSDDFLDGQLQATGPYTKTTTGNGTVAQSAGAGGRSLFTTNSSTPASGDIASIQRPFAGFTFLAGCKAFFGTRVQMAGASATALLAGLIQTTVTPFTVTDGIYFSKPTGALTGLVLINMIASVPTSLTIPISAYTLADNTYLDLGFTVDRNGVIQAFVNAQLVGYLPQSGIGAVPQSRGAVGTVLTAAGASPALTTAALNPTLALQSGTASSKTGIFDFWLAARER